MLSGPWSICAFHSSQPFTCAGLCFPAALNISNKHQLPPNDLKVFFFQKRTRKLFVICQVQTVLYINPGTIQKQLDWWHDTGLLTQLRDEEIRDFTLVWDVRSALMLFGADICVQVNSDLFLVGEESEWWVHTVLTHTEESGLQSMMKIYLNIHVTLPKRPHFYQQSRYSCGQMYHMHTWNSCMLHNRFFKIFWSNMRSWNNAHIVCDSVATLTNTHTICFSPSASHSLVVGFMPYPWMQSQARLPLTWTHSWSHTSFSRHMSTSTWQNA